MASAPGEQLQETIARRWREIEQCFDTETAWRSFSSTLLSLLRQLDEADGNPAEVIKRIEQLLGTSAAYVVLTRDVTPPGSRPRSRGGLDSPWASEGKRDATAPAPPASLSRHTLINVLYGTDRVPLEARDGRARYDNQSAESLSFGAATVSIPDRNTHIKGRLERPRWYRLEFRENPDMHVVIASLERIDEVQFVARARTARESDGSNDDALLFIHGYNVGLEDSILRAAQFATDLEFPGLAIAYSWPSKNSLLGYSADANVSESSMFRLAEFIGLIRSRLGLKRLHIVAHSMGNRVLARALNQHVLTAPPDAGAALNQVVFAAPDIDPATFGGFAEVFAKSCQRCTLYTSAHDMALTASNWIYRRARAGAAASAVVEYGVDAIDASKVDKSMLGHAYFSSNRVLLQDLSELLFSGRGPDKRYGLTSIRVGTQRYWQFDA
jgi:esterase/lipase superfamily enzyme